MRRVFICVLLLNGCAAPTRTPTKEITTAPTPLPAHAPRAMIVYVPQTDEAAAAWMKWFTQYPSLRMVIAMSPHFQRFSKDPLLKSQSQALVKAGRLEIALQIPNAPILPLLVDTNSAKDALPEVSALPKPAYAYPEDVTQLIAQSKSDFFRQWNVLPRGLVVPYGAASPQLLSLLGRLGFSWTVAALQSPAVDGPYQLGSLDLWDATPSGDPVGTRVRVWDEREMKDRPLDRWLKEIEEKNESFILPSDPAIPAQPWRPDLSANRGRGRRRIGRCGSVIRLRIWDGRRCARLAKRWRFTKIPDKPPCSGWMPPSQKFTAPKTPITLLRWECDPISRARGRTPA